MAFILITSTDPEQHGNYTRWLRRLDPSADLSFVESARDVPAAFSDARGLLLPGGGDPDPALYGRPDLLPFCDVDAERDRLEFAAIHHAVEQGVPILGICRGLQIMNVALGGTLIADLPMNGYEMHHRVSDGDRLHEIRIETNSLLHETSGSEGAIVNSAHHQGVDIVAPRLAVSARSIDGLPEALEWRSRDGNPFLLLLHWHPERLPDEHPLADSIGRAFLEAVGR